MWGQDDDDVVGWGDDEPGGLMSREVREAMSEAEAERNSTLASGEAPPDDGSASRHYASHEHALLLATAMFDSLRSTKEHIIDLMRTQVDRAAVEDTVANEAIAGDHRAHVMLITLLPANMQRDVFMAVVTREAAYPRVRNLFGAPPYAFLRPEDAGMLRAEGFASSRRNVAYGGFHIVNYSQFGAPHLVDTYGRQYRVAQEKDDEMSPVAFRALRRGGDPRVTFVVRIMKRARSVRAAMLRDQIGKVALAFPRVGEVVRMRPTPMIIRMLSASASDAEPVDVRIVGIRVADSKAATAVVVGVIQ